MDRHAEASQACPEHILGQNLRNDDGIRVACVSFEIPKIKTHQDARAGPEFETRYPCSL